jgi:signal transduction histidine kinase
MAEPLSLDLQHRKPLLSALREIAIFSDLSDEKLLWFASNAEDLLFGPGDFLIREGDPADALIVLLEGEIRGWRQSAGPDSSIYIGKAGQVTGMLPFSRMTQFPVTIRAVLPVRIASLSTRHFPEMLQRIPELLPRLVGVLADRIRESSRMDQQREKLMALGKISAGLAHELNNPSSAARRSAESLRLRFREFREINQELDALQLRSEEYAALTQFEKKVLERSATPTVLDALEQSDREEILATTLARQGIRNSSRIAASMAELDVRPEELTEFVAQLRAETVAPALSRLVATVDVENLTREIESSTTRISELVRAVKEYSYMDQAHEQEIDIHQGIESTLTMLKFRLKKGVNVTRAFDRTLPRVFAHGSELNQVWTNLIDNAIDAMNGHGELFISTSRELDTILVEFVDGGPGIPEELKSHIFEPFFTTKGVGEGTGLGLDTVYRIVRAHHGDVRFDSQPGRTSFQVRLPIQTR